ncbi:MAG: TIGR01777 family oxidoreductase [Blastocatellia bacterium]|nr:TIGR01777 family oxidoreductase [Blastocatellia bacterium]
MSIRPRVFVTGASGFVGGYLLKALTAQGYDIIALSRSTRKPEGAVRWIAGDSTRSGEWQKEVDGCQAVINLAGESVVGKRWSTEQKEQIRASRVETTNRLVEAIEQAQTRPQAFIAASAIGYYPKNEETAFDETSPAASDFLGEVCRAWEQAALPVTSAGVRLVWLRIGIVLGIGGGALEKMLPPFKLGLGGPLGSGTQWMSWIHVDDVVGLIQYALGNPQVSGPLNAVTPNPVRMNEFATELGQVLHRPTFFFVPGFAIELLLGEAASVVLDSQKVLPLAVEKAGYKFKFPKLGQALRDLLQD